VQVLVKIPVGAYRELEEDLQHIPPRSRAERLRLLAALGLMMLVNRISPIESSAESVNAVPQQENQRQIARELKDLLKASLS
jgi:hypothetical protein